MPTVRLFLALIGVVFVAACSHSPASPTSPSSAAGGAQTLTADALAGTWNLVDIQMTDQPPQTTPAGASYTLTFSGNRLSTRADCNTCGGAFTLSGQTLTAGPALACTRAACPTMTFESVYTRVLAGESTVTLTGNALVLTSARGTLRFAR